MMYKDVFICHTSLDKDAIVRPVYNLLSANNVDCWVDEAEIRWGDSLIEKVNEGLRVSRFVIVVLSEHFVGKPWPERELNAALNIEASSGQTKVLPLLAGSVDVRAQIFTQYPLLNDKLYMQWPEDRDRMVAEVKNLLRDREVESRDSAPRETNPGREISLPEIPIEPTQLERDEFAEESFAQVRDYFCDATDRLRMTSGNVEADVRDINNRRFGCSVYVTGARAGRCEIWLGSELGTECDQIYYWEGSAVSSSGNSFNECLSVSRDALAWEPLGLHWKANQPTTLASGEEVGQYLWELFAARLSSR